MINLNPLKKLKKKKEKRKLVKANGLFGLQLKQVFWFT